VKLANLLHEMTCCFSPRTKAPSKSNNRSAALAHFERAITIGTQIMSRVPPGTAPEKTRWRQQLGDWHTELSYEDVSVAQIVEDMNRFFPRPLRVPDPALATRLLSGTDADTLGPM
jgi:ferric-dicitrate binding protein FerR (iron transport regulator)